MVDDKRSAIQPDSTDQPPAEFDRPDRPSDAQAVDSEFLIARQMWYGPLPPPAALNEYKDVVADGAERIVSMVEQQTIHRMKMEEMIVESDLRLAQRGQWIGLAVVLAVLAIAGYMAYLGATTAAAVVAGIDLVGLAAVFVYGSLRGRVIQIEDDDPEERPDTSRPNI